MASTDFARLLTRFLTAYLAHERGVSRNTVKAYKDTFVLLINFLAAKGIRPEKLKLADITKETINSFLNWLQAERGVGNATRNARLAAIRSFYRFIQYEEPERMYEAQRILSVRSKRSQGKAMSYLTLKGITLLLNQPKTDTYRGLRDLALLSLMYDTGARVQEVVDFTPGCLRLDPPYTIRINGKGNKTRIVPLQEEQIKLLREYMKANQLDTANAQSYPLFFNCWKEKLTRAGVSHVLLKYATAARKENDSLIPAKISCHSIRHSKAMHLLQAGVNLVYIRDFLGHVSVTTTEVYARADSKQKREALQKAYVEVKPNVDPLWLKNRDLLGWLKSF